MECLAVMHGGGPAPGMNTAVRAAARLGLDRGYSVLAVKNGFLGVRNGDIQEMDWMSVSGWVSEGGAEIGTNRYVPDEPAIAEIAEQLAAHRIDGLLMAGGWTGYQAAYLLHTHRRKYASLDIPIVCIPMTINNDLPGTELTIGSDTALDSIVTDDLSVDVQNLSEGFRSGKRLGLVIRCENADPVYTAGFITSVFEKEGGDLFDARPAILGHVQEGGDPSPFDRVQATGLTAHWIDYLAEQLQSGGRASAIIGLQSGHLQFTDLTSYPTLIDENAQRPREQRWLTQLPLAEIMTTPRA